MQTHERRSAALRTAAAGVLTLSMLGGAVRPAAAGNEDIECLIEPQRVVKLSSAVEGLLETVEVDRGDRVTRGQVVATLESGAEKAARDLARERAARKGDLTEAQARVSFAEREHARQLKLREQNVVAERLLDEAKTNLERSTADLEVARESLRLARIELEQAEAQLERRRVRSPIDGVVTRRLLHPGEYVDSTELLEIAQVDPLRVEALLPASLYGKIETGSTALVVAEDGAGPGHPARVTVVDPVIDGASGTFGVRLELPNADRSLPAGLKCRVRFPTGVAVTAPAEQPPAAPAR
jgi:RND family efflux transporter MFP subunit